MTEETFPVLGAGPACPKTVPLAWVERFDAKIANNHGDNAATLAHRGGVTAAQLYLAFHGRPCIEGLVTDAMAELWLAEMFPVEEPTPAEDDDLEEEEDDA